MTQADIARAIRALKAEGCPAVRVVMRDGGVIVEPADRADVDRRHGSGNDVDASFEAWAASHAG